MFVVMLSLLMLQLRSFSKLFLVFLTAPLGLIGRWRRCLPSTRPSASWRFWG